MSTIIKKVIKQKTYRARHAIACTLIPTLIQQSDLGYYFSRNVPRPTILIVNELAKDRRQTSLVGAEIGVDEGANAENMLAILPLKRLYLIDPYSDGDERFKNTKEKLQSYLPATFLRLTSYKASFVIDKAEPNGLDFVYIDGDHSYETVFQDLVCYEALLKYGGIIGGHDWIISSVSSAVRKFEFLFSTKFNISYPDFWMVKH